MTRIELFKQVQRTRREPLPRGFGTSKPRGGNHMPINPYVRGPSAPIKHEWSGPPSKLLTET